MEMVSATFISNFKQSLNEKKISLNEIDQAVRNILRLKFRLGLFENPYIPKIRKQSQWQSQLQ